jgi:hypothetical protein
MKPFIDARSAHTATLAAKVRLADQFKAEVSEGIDRAIKDGRTAVWVRQGEGIEVLVEELKQLGYVCTNPSNDAKVMVSWRQPAASK